VSDEREQELLDLQDLAALLKRVASLRGIVDECREEEQRLARELKATKRRLKEAGWNLAAAERAASEAIARANPRPFGANGKDQGSKRGRK
jgi:predicted  nucleic acid-binding Zn-ribbon protein